MNVTINANLLVVVGFLLICAAYWLGVATCWYASTRALRDEPEEGRQ